MSKIDQLSEQISFLLKVQEESLSECGSEFESLTRFLDGICASSGSDKAVEGAEVVRSFLSKKITQMTEDFESDVECLREQRDIVEKARTLPESERRDELIGLILEEAGDIVETAAFKKSVLDDSKDSKREFIYMINDIKSAVQSGGLDELEELFEAMELDNSEENDQEDDLNEESDCCASGCSGCSLNDGCDQVKEALDELSDPYVVLEKDDSADS